MPPYQLPQEGLAFLESYQTRKETRRFWLVKINIDFYLPGQS
jgi:hypothetical protein